MVENTSVRRATPESSIPTALLVTAVLLGLAAPPRATLAQTETAWPTYDLETIRIEGNSHTAEALILEAANLPLGNRLEEKLLDLARDRIHALGLFRSVSFRLEKGSAPGRVILVVAVEERPSFVVTDFFLGWTSISPFYAGGGVADTNFLGRNLIQPLHSLSLVSRLVQRQLRPRQHVIKTPPGIKRHQALQKAFLQYRVPRRFRDLEH